MLLTSSSYDLPVIEQVAKPDVSLNYAQLRQAIELNNLSADQFCTRWREAAAQAHQQGNLVAIKLLLVMLDKAPAFNTGLGQLSWHEARAKLNLIEGAFDKAAYYFSGQFNFAQKLGEPSELELAQLNLARASLYQFKLDEVASQLKEAEKWAEISGDPILKIKVLNRHAELAAYLHRNEQSIELARQALELAQHYQLPFEQAFAFNWLGVNFTYRRQWELARQALEAALRLRQSIRDVVGRAETLANLGKLYLKQGEYTLARAALDSGLAIVEQLRHRPGIAQLFYQKAQLLYRTSDPNEALKLAQGAVEARLVLEEPTKLAEAFSLLGQIYKDLGQLKYALICHLRVWELYRTTGNYTNPQWIELLTGVGDYLLQLHQGSDQENISGYWQEALQCYRAAIVIIENNSELYYLAPLLGKMAWALLKLEGLAGLNEAMRCFRLQLNLLGDIASPFFEAEDAIIQRAQAVNGLQICAALLRRQAG